MEIYKISNLSFSYPTRSEKTLKNINLSIKQGEFVTIFGKSGCGKTTLLRLLKPSISPHGIKEGEILYDGEIIDECSERRLASDVGFVMQSPDDQIVTDTVWHELAFGPESLGMKTSEIRVRVAEMASFFSIENWFYKKISELSGGQKQLLNLASVMVMQPEVLILDEPASQLDPVAATEFFETLKKINNELGTTIILTEHRTEEVLAMSDRVVIMDDGEITACDTPRNIGKILKAQKHDMYDALPVPVRVFGYIGNDSDYPLTLREGREKLIEYNRNHPLDRKVINQTKRDETAVKAVEVKNLYFRYEKDCPDVIRDLNLTVYEGEIFAITGGNGAGKTTAVSLLSGLYKPQRGKIRVFGEDIVKKKNLYNGLMGVLPQNPQSIFAGKTLYDDLYGMIDDSTDKADKEKMITDVAKICRVENLLGYHPYDLSGGEQQRAALAMVLLRNPRILILDEPTKGMDVHFKKTFGAILGELKSSGVTVIMVSHDIEFCAAYADCCAMFFDGGITSQGTPREFFGGNNFYTTVANRMSRKVLPGAILADDIIRAAGKEPENNEKNENHIFRNPTLEKEENKKKGIGVKRIFLGIFFLACMGCIWFFKGEFDSGFDGAQYIFYALNVLFAGLGAVCLIPQKEIGVGKLKKQGDDRHKFISTVVTAISLLVFVPLTIFFGNRFLDGSKYYLVCLMVMLEIIVPFFFSFEKRKPRAREIVIISVLCAMGVVSRTAFFMLPEFKPVFAVVIIAGICFGGETGFFVGAVTAFVSNFFFGQGPWTPWQMFALGITGFLGGIIFGRGIAIKTKLSLTLFGFFAVIVVYGCIMNAASVLLMADEFSLSMLKMFLIMGLPVDFLHGISTAVFLWLASVPMIEKLERIKVKYGLIG